MNKNYIYKDIIKKLMLIIFTCSILVTMTSCKSNKIQTLDNAIAIVYLNNSPYLINDNNKTVSLERYDNIIPIFDDYLIVIKNELYGYINKKGEEIIAPQYQLAYPMKENKAVVVSNNLYHIIDNLGNIIYTFDNDIISSSYFVNNHLLIEKEQKLTYLQYENNSFTIKGDFIYDYAERFYGEFAVVGIKDPTIKYNYLKTDGTYLLDSFDYDFAEHFSEDFARVGSIDKLSKSGFFYYYLNSDGELLQKDIDDRQSSDDIYIKCEYGLPFQSNVAIIAKYIQNDPLIKEYTIINNEGKAIYLEQTRLYNNNSLFPGRIFPHQFIGLDNINHCFIDSGASGTNAIKFVQYNGFENTRWDFENADEWLTKLAEMTYQSANFLKTQVQTPYNMGDLKISEHYDNQTPIVSARIYGGYVGLIKVDLVNIDGNEYGIAYSSYLIPPLYEQIIY